MLRVSRALKLRIGLRVKLRAELRAELQGEAPWTPLRTACSIYCVASIPGGQRCCKAFGRAFGRAFAELRTELRAELLQGFGRALCRAFVELYAELSWSSMQSFCRALAKLRCFEVRHVYSAGRYRPRLFLDQSKACLAKFEIQDPKVIDHSYLGSIIQLQRYYSI